MSAIMKLRQARNPDQIAEALEPLAVSMATLADQLNEAAEQSKAAASLSASLVREQVEALTKTAASMERLAVQWQQERIRSTWAALGLAGISSILAAMLSTVLWLWLAPAPEVRNTLDPAAVAEHLKPALIEALRPAPKGK
jgi:hypothetical protein